MHHQLYIVPQGGKIQTLYNVCNTKRMHAELLISCTSSSFHISCNQHARAGGTQ